MTDTPNAITPRMIAVALLHEAVDRAVERAESHERNSRDLTDIYQSRIRVFLRQTAVELKLAALLLERYPDPPPEDFQAMDDTGDPLNDKRWRTAMYALAVIGSVDLVQLIVLIYVLLNR